MKHHTGYLKTGQYLFRISLQVELKNVLAVMETKRTDFDNMRQDVNKVKKYASDLQTFIGVNEMTRVLDGEVKKQKGACNYDLFVISELIFSNVPSMYLRSLSICKMAVDDLTFSVTS
jgi:hypothetical protein